MVKVFGTQERVESALQVMQADSRFSQNDRDNRELILLRARLSRLNKQIERGLVTTQEVQVELNRLLYSLQSIAQLAGIKNFFEYLGIT